jgi:hypothetical protein
MSRTSFDLNLKFTQIWTQKQQSIDRLAIMLLPGEGNREMQDLNLEGLNGNRMCAEIVKIDSTVIIASFSSFSGYELAFAESAAMPRLVGRNANLKDKFCSMVAAGVSSVKQAGVLFEHASTIIVNFEKNLRIVAILFTERSIHISYYHEGI